MGGTGVSVGSCSSDDYSIQSVVSTDERTPIWS